MEDNDDHRRDRAWDFNDGQVCVGTLCCSETVHCSVVAVELASITPSCVPANTYMALY